MANASTRTTLLKWCFKCLRSSVHSDDCHLSVSTKPKWFANSFNERIVHSGKMDGRNSPNVLASVCGHGQHIIILLYSMFILISFVVCGFSFWAKVKAYMYNFYCAGCLSRFHICWNRLWIEFSLWKRRRAGQIWSSIKEKPIHHPKQPDSVYNRKKLFWNVECGFGIL